MVQFISRNPVTATMQANEARSLQADQINEQRRAAQERRAMAAEQNALNSGIAKIFSEEPAPPVPVPDELGGGPPAPSPIRSFGDKTREAVKLAAASPVGGETALRLAQDNQKRRDTAQLDAMKAIHDGDYARAGALSQEHGLGLESTLNNPNALHVATNLIKSIPAKLEPAQALAFQDAAAAEFGKVFGETRNHAQAYQAAGRAGLLAANKAPQKIKHFATDDTGKVTGITEYGEAVPTAVRGRTTRTAAGGVGGAGGDASKGAKYDVDGDGFRVILYRDGTMVYPKDAKGNAVKIRAGTDQDQKFVRDLAKTFAGKSLVPPEDPVAAARDIAAATSGRGGVPTAAPANALPPGIPPGARQVGTSGGKPVFQDSNGKRYIVE